MNVEGQPDQPFDHLVRLGAKVASVSLSEVVFADGDVLPCQTLVWAAGVGERNRLSVLLNWAWNYLTWDRGPRLILRPDASRVRGHDR